MWAVAWLVACGGGAGRIHLEEPIEPLAGAGWGLSVPAGAVVERSPGVLKVDAPDGRSWFDVAWTDRAVSADTAEAVGRGSCAGILLDQAWSAGGRLATGGVCEIAERRHWIVVVLERVGDRTLETTFLADAERMPYEDAWVELARTALTLGAEPLPPADVAAVREAVRAAGHEPAGDLPVPGGGLLATRVAPGLAPVWTARDASPPAGTFDR